MRWEELVLPVLSQTFSLASTRSRVRLSASNWNPTPVTSCTETLAAGWLGPLTQLQAVLCSSLPGEINSSDPRYQPQGADLRSDQSRCCRALKPLPVADLSGCTPPPGSALCKLAGELFYGLCRGIILSLLRHKRWRLPAPILLRILMFSPWCLMQVSTWHSATYDVLMLNVATCSHAF